MYINICKEKLSKEDHLKQMATRFNRYYKEVNSLCFYCHIIKHDLITRLQFIRINCAIESDEDFGKFIHYTFVCCYCIVGKKAFRVTLWIKKFC